MSRRVVGNKAILIIDLISILIGIYGIYATVFTIQLPDFLAGGGHWQFLTNLSLIYSMVVFIIGFFAHLAKSQALFNFKNLIHPVGVALESVVFLVYWPLRLFFFELIASDPNIVKLPIRVDLAIHLMPLASLLIDYLVFMPKWTIKNTTALLILSALTTGYWFLLKRLIDVENGARYPYGFLNTDTEQQRVILFGLIGSIAFIQIVFFRKIYDVIVRTTKKSEIKIDQKLKKKI